MESDESRLGRALWAGLRWARGAFSRRRSARGESSVATAWRVDECLIAQMSDAVLAVTAEGRIALCNPAAERLFDASRAALVGQPLGRLLIAQAPDMPARTACAVPGRRLDGSPLRLLVSVCSHAEREGTVLLLRSHPKADASLLAWDPLIGLPGRHDLYAQLSCEMSGATSRRLAVLLIDLDDFRAVNDSCGYRQGDQVLAKAAQRIRAAAPARSLFARLGGDEFALLLSGLDAPDEAAATASAVRRTFDAPLMSGSRPVFVSVSIGLAVYPDDAASDSQLLHCAELALRQAKADGRGCTRRYTPGFGRGDEDMLELQALLRDAVASNQFHLHYQPQLGLDDGCVCGFEALLRWTHPRRGPIDPVRFIRAAEAGGLIVPIGYWVLDAVCAQIRALCELGFEVPIAANLSAHQLRDAGLVTHVESALTRNGVPPRLLELELTESAVMDDPDAAARTLAQLRALGVRIALDDFGIGHTSLARLQYLPVDRLKIDRAFVANLGGTGRDGEVLRGIVDLARRLDLTVLAEGVETGMQLQRVIEAGCDQVQGWLLSRELSADMLDAYLRRMQSANGPRGLETRVRAACQLGELGPDSKYGTGPGS